MLQSLRSVIVILHLHAEDMSSYQLKQERNFLRFHFGSWPLFEALH